MKYKMDVRGKGRPKVPKKIRLIAFANPIVPFVGIML